MKLTSHIAVQDLMALARFVLQPHDDLSLAALLKSPLLDMSEGDVFAVCALRPEQSSAWDHLKAYAEDGQPRFKSVADELDRLMALSRQLSVHHFFAHVLSATGGRRRFLGRLGGEASDVLDEFLTLALEQESKALPACRPLSPLWRWRRRKSSVSRIAAATKCGS